MRNIQTLVKLVLVVFCLAGWSISVFSQPFDSGSDGSYGPIVVTGSLGLQVPDDGIFHATTVTINTNGFLGLVRNAANTPVYILAQGDVFIGGNAAITVNGEVPGSQIGGLGGPGGFDGGARGVAGAPPGDGHGPGGGNGGVDDSNDPDYVGSGSFATTGLSPSPNNGATYGTALMMPMVGGSGGGGTDAIAGGGGAGAITIASNTQITLLGTGGIQAIGASIGGNGDGSGGSIRLVAPKIIGSGYVNANGAGGSGRARVDLIDFSEFNIVGSGNTEYIVGSLMQVFPTTSPSLAIIEAAGEVIPEGSTAPVDIFLADGTPSTQNVVVQARDFTGMVPIRVKVTPDSGDSVAYDDTIDMGTGNPATVTVAVQIPVNEPVSIEAWTTNP